MARLVGINHIALEVGDVEEALAWYGRFFEFELRGRAGARMAFIDMGDQFIALAAGRTQPADEDRHFWGLNPVGDIAARYYGPTGQPIRGAVEDRILGVTLDDLIAIPHVIGVAHGRAKAPGVLGALRGHLIDSLVCDEALARHLLSEARTASASDNGGS